MNYDPHRQKTPPHTSSIRKHHNDKDTYGARNQSDSKSVVQTQKHPELMSHMEHIDSHLTSQFQGESLEIQKLISFTSQDKDLLRNVDSTIHAHEQDLAS